MSAPNPPGMPPVPARDVLDLVDPLILAADTRRRHARQRRRRFLNYFLPLAPLGLLTLSLLVSLTVILIGA